MLQFVRRTRSLPLAVLLKAEPRRYFLLHPRVVAEALDPLDARLATEPCELALGVVAHVELGLLDCALERTPAPQVLDDAAVAVRPQGARTGGHAAREQAADFFDQAGAEVRLGALVDPPVEFGARGPGREDAQ